MRHPRPAAAVLVAVLSLVVAGPARAAVHTVAPGESLSSIAAADGLTVAALAAANGLPADAGLLAGSTVQIPAVGAVPAGAPAQPATPVTGTPAPSAGAPEPLGGYTVRPGDTLSALETQTGVPAGQIAYANGLDPAGVLLAGTVLRLPAGSPAPARASVPAPATRVVPAGGPQPSAGRVTSSDIHTVAARNGVDGALASAIGWQESGFNNGMVSSANARGVMQVMPGTWDWVQTNLAKRQLDPTSALDNVGAGVLYLGALLKETGGDQALAAAGYYQGLASVRKIGMLPETRRYVANVMALRSRFGG